MRITPTGPPRPRVAGFLALLGALGTPAAAQEVPAVAPAFAEGQWLEPDADLELRITSPLPPGAGSFAVLLAGTDLTAVLETSRDRLVYRPRGVLLPAGEHALVVYHVDPAGAWREVHRSQVRILTRRGFQQASVAPKLALHNEGQVAEGHSAPAFAPTRATYQDFMVNSGLSTTHLRPDFSLRSQANVLAVTERDRALRFAQQRDGAPLVDLADFLVMFERSSMRLSVGHVAFAGSRHLMQSQATRGVTAELRPLRGATLTLGAVGGRPMVGWQRPLGVGADDSHLFTANLGVELVPRRPGVLRVDAVALDGELPVSAGYNQGAITDRERSRGGELRIQASDPSRRISLEAGYARSRFDNPPDPFLSGGFLIIPTRPAIRGARHASLRAEVLRSPRLIGTMPASLAFALRHERVAPLFRSVAAATRADIQENVVEMTAGLGAIGVQFARSRSEDNLDRIASILRTLTRSDRASLALPLGALLGGSRLLPQVSYNFSRVHQAGDGLPVNGEFQESHVPDQVSRLHNLRVDWYAGRTRLGYALSRSDQDNRQPGRERADFEALVHTASVGFSPARRIDLGLDASLETAESLEREERTRNLRLGGSLDVRPTRTTSIGAQLTSNRYTQEAFDLRNTTTDVRLQLSQRVTFHQRTAGSTGGQLFVRFARHSATASGLGALADPRRIWTLNTGFTLSVF